ALTQAQLTHGKPGAALLHQVQLHAQVQQFAHLGDALSVHDVELRLPEGGRHLVLHNLGPGAVADDLGAALQGLDTPHVDAHRGIELQGPAASGDLRVAVDHAHLLAQLVDEDDDTVGLGDAAGQLPQ